MNHNDQAYQALSDDLTIIIDSREEASGLPKLLRESDVFDVRGRLLEVGDVQIGDLVIERKTIPDLERSLEDGRLLSQAVIMRRVCPKRLYIIEGDRKALSHPLCKGLESALLSISVRMQMPIVYSRDLNHTARIIIKCAMWQYRLGGSAAALRFRKPKEDDAFRRVYMLLGLPKIGPFRARKLLEKFGSIKGICNATEEQMRGIEGIGPSVAREIFRLVGGESSEGNN